MKVKAFNSGQSLDNLEALISLWLLKNPSVNIHFIKYAECHFGTGHSSRYSYSCLIFFSGIETK